MAGAECDTEIAKLLSSPHNFIRCTNCITGNSMCITERSPLKNCLKRKIKLLNPEPRIASNFAVQGIWRDNVQEAACFPTIHRSGLVEVVLLQYVRSRAIHEGTLQSGQRRRHAQRRVPRALAACRQRSRQPHQQVTQCGHAH